jgi:hypothetical protein
MRFDEATMTDTLTVPTLKGWQRARRAALPLAPQEKAVRFLLVLTITLAAALVGGLVFQVLTEPGGSNAYALVADAFLHGRLHVDGCFDVDCAVFDGHTYIVFPPAPALIAIPFVAIFGVTFSGFVALSAIITGVALLVWWRIFTAMAVERSTALWLLLALGFGTPLYYVTIRGDGVWFLAQSCAFLATTLAIWAVLEKRNPLLAGVFVGFSLLCRQMTVLVLPFLFALSLRPDEPQISFRRSHLLAALKLGLPVAVALLIYFAFNYARFGDPLDTGYGHIGVVPNPETFLTDRMNEIGLFSRDYVAFNLFHLLFQGFHVDFVGPNLTEVGELDVLGTSLLAASPFVLLIVFAPLRRPVVIGALCALAMIVPMLFYHSNGFTQYNAQRYVLDWLPMLVYALALAVGPSLRPALAVLVTYAVGLNTVAATVAYLSQP